MHVNVDRLRFLALLVCAVMFSATLIACTGTRAAYEAADTLPETAIVVSEHYYALLRETNELIDRGAPRSFTDRAQEIERRATPLVLSLRDAAETYSAVTTAANEAELAAALDEAVPLVSDLMDLILSLRE